MTFYIAPIVEGDTEVLCIERLLHRIWTELFLAPLRLQVLLPSRAPRTGLVHPKGAVLGEKVDEATDKILLKLSKDKAKESRGMVLLLLDAEGDCPATFGPELSLRASGFRTDVTVSCVLAARMFENWILAGASSLNGINGLPELLPERDRFDDCGGAAWLDNALRSNNRKRRYKKTMDAAITFIQHMNLQECRENLLSFQTLLHRLESQLPPPTSE